MMMNKSINQLEKERLDKIRGLKLPEIKSYLNNLNRKMYFSNENEDIDFYSGKIIETFDVIEKKYLMEAYHDYLVSQIDLLSWELFKESFSFKMSKVCYASEIFHNGYVSLITEFESLKSLFKIYYLCYVRQSNEFSHILEALDEEYDFRNEDFDNYLRSYHIKNNHHLTNEFDLSIYRLILSLKFTIESLDRFEDEYNDKYIGVLIKKAKSEIDANQDSNDIIELLSAYLKSIECLIKWKDKYIEIKGEVLEFISKEDGFIEEKEKYYNQYSFMRDSSDKETILKSNPFYNFEDKRLSID